MTAVSSAASGLSLGFRSGVLRVQQTPTVADALQKLRLPATRPVAQATAAAGSVASARAGLASVPDALRQAYATLTQRLQSVRSIHWVQLPGGEGHDATHSSLAATHRVNEQGAGTQSSTAALGLNLNGPATAKLTSTAVLGLDFSQAPQASTLAGTTDLALDLTTPEAPSQLISNSALGLDTTTPGAHSTLSSTEEINTSDDQGTPVSVDPDALFDDEDPDLRPSFDNGAQVSTGSFTINGTAVDVLAGDSINNVLARINSTVSGVTASLQDDRITLESTADSEDDILLADDTSGFLAAVKLADATTVKGNVADDQQVLAKTVQFASISSGTFTLNGVVIEVNRDTDSLQSLLAKMNASGAAVAVTYDADSDKIHLTTDDPVEQDIPVGDDTTGLLDALGLSSGESIRGTVNDLHQVLNELPGFSSLLNGSFTINGVTIEAHPNIETLQDLLARINNSSAGVTASYHAETGHIELTGNEPGENEVTLADDSVGFFQAAGLDGANTVRGHVRDDLETFAQSDKLGSVNSGSFSVNGTTIALDRDTDTLQSIVDRINQSVSGVTATYDSDTDRVVLHQDSEDDIVLANDDTGFLAATGLSDAITEHPATRDDEKVLNSTTQFSAVTSGSFSVNHVSLSIDPTVDTLASILTRINEAGAGVTARYDEESDRVVVTSDNGEPLTLDDDTTGFLEAAHLPTGASGTRINPDAAFNSVDNPPGFEDSFPVSAGSFEINGVAIDVAEDDSLNAVLARITASGAGVTATFDSVSQRVTLTAQNAGARDITLGDDSSGFLAAVKLDDSADRTVGQDEDHPVASWTRVETDTGRRALNDPLAAANDLAGAFNQLNSALERVRQAGVASPLFRSDTERVLQSALDTIPDATNRGLTLTANSSALRLNVDVRRLADALASDPKSVLQFFRGAENLPDGLANLLSNYDESSAASAVPASSVVSGSAVTGGAIADARQFLIGGQTVADLVQANSDRQLELLTGPASPPPASKVRSTYGVPLEGVSTPA